MLKRATNRGVLINVLLNMQWPLLVFQLLFGDFARSVSLLPFLSSPLLRLFFILLHREGNLDSLLYWLSLPVAIMIVCDI